MRGLGYSVLTIKAVDAERRLIQGTATTPTPDRVGDIVDPAGARFAREIPLLLFHDTRLPVGTVRLQKPTHRGIDFEASLPDVQEPPALRDRIAEAWASVRAGLIKGTSIGFKAADAGIEVLKGGGLKFTDYEILELSLVSVPANAEATIAQIKSLDAAALAAPGSGDSSTPGATGRPVVSLRRSAPTMTIKDQLKDFEATREAKSARMTALMTAAGEKGETLDETASQEYDGLEAEVEKIDAHLVRLHRQEKALAAQAKAVDATDATKGTASRDPNPFPVISVKDVLPKGIGFARAVKVFGVAKLDGRNPMDIVKDMYPHDESLAKYVAHEVMLPTLIGQLKAAVPAATTTNSLWAGALSNPVNLAGEFIEYLRPATIIGRLNLRNIPTNVRVIEQTQGGTGYWVGQGAPKPLTSFGYAPVTLSPTKVAAIAVASEEALRYSTPSLDMLIRDGLRDALVARVDQDLLDPAEAGTANVQPASLTNGLTALSSAGTSADNIRTDIATLLQTFRAANLRGPIVLVMPDSLAVAAAFMATALGTSEFPDLTAEGGSIRGIRVLTSQYVANQSGSGNMIVAIAEQEVFRSDDGGVTVDASREASLQMLDNPTNNSATATATSMVSMWQTNSVAFRGEWYINWQKRRSDAVVYMDDVNWGSVGSP